MQGRGYPSRLDSQYYIGANDLLTLFWANEIFDQSNPDTYYAEV